MRCTCAFIVTINKAMALDVTSWATWTSRYDDDTLNKESVTYVKKTSSQLLGKSPIKGTIV